MKLSTEVSAAATVGASSRRPRVIAATKVIVDDEFGSSVVVNK